jgi:hypothetical protein
MDDLLVKTVVTSWKQIVSRLDERFAPLDGEQLQKQIAPNKNRPFLFTRSSHRRARPHAASPRNR